jgi:GTPase SAR1 family protein
MKRLTALRYRASVVGPKGSGKTTFLRDLKPRLEAKGFSITTLRLSANDKRHSRLLLKRIVGRTTPDRIVMIDGAEQLSGLSRFVLKMLTAKAGGLIVTSHVKSSAPPLIECSTSVELLDDIIQNLLGDRPYTFRETAHALFEKHNDNIRDTLRALYDLWSAIGC